MSRQNKVNPGMYTQRGRLAQDDAARELQRQRSVGAPRTWQHGVNDKLPSFKGSPPNPAPLETEAKSVKAPAARKTAAKKTAATKPVATKTAAKKSTAKRQAPKPKAKSVKKAAKAPARKTAKAKKTKTRG